MTLNRRVFLGGMGAAAIAAGAPPAGSTSRVDRDGMLLINGKRTFLHALYQLPNRPDGMRLAAEAGFHVVHGNATAADLDLAAKHGMYRWLTVGSISKEKAEADRARIAGIVNQWKSHPGLLYWETEDEPSYQWKKDGPRVTPEIIKATYAALKQMDPGHVVYLNHSPTNLVSTLAAYNPGGDILGTDIYPVIPHGIRESYALWPDGRQGDFLNAYPSQVGQYMDKLRKVAGPARSAVMVLQAFAWENLRKEGDRDPKMIVYPTRDELRFMAWHSIVRGANGLVWWGLYSTPAEAPLWDDMAAVTKELRAIEGPLAAGAVSPAGLRWEYHETGHSLDRGIEWIVKPDGGDQVMLAVNADSNPVEATLTGFGAARRVKLAPFGCQMLRRSKS